MYSFVYKLYYALKRGEKRRRETNKPPSRVLNFLLGYCEWFYNIPFARWCEKYPSRKLGVTEKKRDQKIIVSFTSYPKRIGDVWLVVETLLRQSMKPDEVVLWLAESQFPDGLNSLPPRLVALQERGLTIRFCDDLRSHKKYFYAMQEYSEDLIILVDDDTFYSRDLVKKLMDLHRKHPEDIVCMTPAMITGICEMPSKWRSPRWDERVVHSFLAQPYTGQGTLYPPHSMDESVAFCKEKIMELCPHADDLWVKYMSMRKGTHVTAIHKFRSIPVTIYGTAEGSLYYINAEENQNDVQWQNLLEHYGTEFLKGNIDDSKTDSKI